MNVLIQASLAAVAAAAGVTVAVTQSSTPAQPAEQGQRWVPSIVIVGQGHDGTPLYWRTKTYDTEDECKVAVENDPEFNNDIVALLQSEIVAHSNDPTFDVEVPVCRQRVMDPPGQPT